jgi:hypothetical protein
MMGGGIFTAFMQHPIIDAAHRLAVRLYLPIFIFSRLHIRRQDNNNYLIE